MQGRIAGLHLVKGGGAAHEYEDAWHTDADGATFGGELLRAAVADGASEAMLAGRWATLLVRTFTAADPDATLARVVDDAAAGWDAVVEEYLLDRERRNKPIRWFEEPGLHRGAYATLLGLRLFGSGRFDGWALGDSCLLQVRDERLVLAFPLDDAAAFGSAPALAPSRGPDPQRIAAAQRNVTGEWAPADTFYLATDAVAHWILTGGGAQGAAQLAADDFAEQVQDLRGRGEIHDDDVTMLAITLS